MCRNLNLLMCPRSHVHVWTITDTNYSQDSKSDALLLFRLILSSVVSSCSTFTISTAVVPKDTLFPSVMRLYCQTFTVSSVFSYSSPGARDCFPSKQNFLLWLSQAFTTEPNTGNLTIAYPEWYHSDEALKTELGKWAFAIQWKLFRKPV